jgi:hypothetical protein
VRGQTEFPCKGSTVSGDGQQQPTFLFRSKALVHQSDWNQQDGCRRASVGSISSVRSEAVKIFLRVVICFGFWTEKNGSQS